MNKEMYRSLYQEPDNSYDALIVGGSNVYTFWQAPLAWKEYGIAAFPLSTPGLPCDAIPYLIEEAEKTQKQPLIVITVNSIKGTKNYITEERLHWFLDHMRLSPLKLQAVNELSNKAHLGLARLSLVLPVLRFHANWSQLGSEEYESVPQGLKGAATYENFLYRVVDETQNYVESDKRRSLNKSLEKTLTALLSFLEPRRSRVLFVRLPQAVGSESRVAELNSIGDTIQARGFDYLDLGNAKDEIGLDLTEDFDNKVHANARGTIKFTHYFGKYLSDRYGFADKRGSDEYKLWDEAAESYDELLLTSVLPFELNREARNNSIVSPAIMAAATGDGVHLSWTASEHADGYLVYRRMKAPSFVDCIAQNENLSTYAWSHVASLPNNVLSFTDDNPNSKTTYYYTVVPYVVDGDQRVYGRFNINGAEVTTQELKTKTKVGGGVQ